MNKQHTPRNGNRLEWIKVRLSRSEAKELGQLAKAERLSRSQLIGRILNEWREERKDLAAERQLPSQERTA